jgi:trehalose 6-phosphate synthase/trehalose 6-phosphate phosphatase
MSGEPTRPDARYWPELWDRAVAARRRLLLLDFDGTLAPFHQDRDQARPGKRALSLLSEIATSRGCRLGIVSGRPLHELEARFEPVAADLVGEHGWEERRRGGDARRRTLAEGTAELLRDAYAGMRSSTPVGRIERKRTAIVLHTRGLAEKDVSELRVVVTRLWTPLRRHAELELREIDGGWELRARGHHKGTAVSALIGDHGQGGFTLYVGDDETDEDAFAATARSGFAVRVGDPARPTRAHATLPDVEAVLELLEIWRDRVAGAGWR